MTRRRGAAGAALATLLLLAAGCGGGPDPAETAAAPEVQDGAPVSAAPEPEGHGAGDHGADDHGADGHGADDDQTARPVPLRAGERVETIAMPTAYDPSAPNGVGTDDYRCFLLDPQIAQDQFITGVDVVPGTAGVVHHVILFRVPPGSVAEAEAKDLAEPGQGWTCFGGTGLGGGNQLDDAPWLGAWAPGGIERVLARDVGVPVEAGSRIVMQVHYNLLSGPKPDVTAARLRFAPATKDLTPLETMLLPAPVELPCRPERSSGALCERDAAVADVTARFGEQARTADLLHVLCGTEPPGPTQSCDRTIQEPTTIRAAAGHMHLLGKSIRIEVNPDSAASRGVLDIRSWNFDDQGATTVKPLSLDVGDTVRVTCRHSQALRDLLPAFEGQEERWVVWGEGTNDEMCLGTLLVSRP